MKPDKRFLTQPKDFWAHVRLISEHLGYTNRATRQIKVPSLEDQIHALESLGMSSKKMVNLPANRLISANYL